jgi:hypothetical protein
MSVIYSKPRNKEQSLGKFIIQIKVKSNTVAFS